MCKLSERQPENGESILVIDTLTLELKQKKLTTRASYYQITCYTHAGQLSDEVVTAFYIAIIQQFRKII